MSGPDCDWCGAAGEDMDVYTVGDDFICEDCNFRLLDAAPDLFEVALIAQAMLGGDDTGPDDDDMSDVWLKVKSAISKAKGEADAKD